MKPKALISWSSGKDSLLALHFLKQEDKFDIVGLYTTFRSDTKKIAIHEVHESFVEKQAESLGLPLTKIYLPYPCPNTVYENTLSRALDTFNKAGVNHLVFGDLFLKDIRKYRETWLKSNNFEGVFPLWNKNTTQLALEFIDLGYKAKIIAVQPKTLPCSVFGREYNNSFLMDLPKDIDPCGENGEFHTFTYDGPLFKFPVAFPTLD